MKTTIMFASAIALATPALAQQTAPPAEAATEVESKTAVDAAADTPVADATVQADATVAADPTVAADTTAEATADAAVQAEPATEPEGTASVAAIVAAEFPGRDADGDGELTESEFTEWMVALRAASEASAAPPEAELRSWAGAAFAQADTDRSASVSQPELTVFLQG